MDTAIKHARFLKYGLLGITLATLAYVTQSTSFTTNAASLAADSTVAQVTQPDTPTVNKLWSDYEAVFIEQEKAISEISAEVENATAELDTLITAIDQDMSDFMAIDADPNSSSAAIQLGFVSLY